MQAAFASSKASRPAPVVAPGEPEKVDTTAKKSCSRNALEANWRDDRTALVSTYGYRLHGARTPRSRAASPLPTASRVQVSRAALVRGVLAPWSR